MEQFTYVKRGYDPEEVDRYIATLEQVIKSYKEKDNAIKNAIISAQMAADNMIKNAKAQADEYKTQISKELDKVSVELDRQRMRIQAFQDVYSGMIRQYLTDLDSNDITDLYARIDDVDKMVNRLKEVDLNPQPTPLPALRHEEINADVSYAQSSYAPPVHTPLPPVQPPPSITQQQPIINHYQSPPPPPQPQPPQPRQPKPQMPQHPPLSLGPNSSPSRSKGSSHIQNNHDNAQHTKPYTPHPSIRANDEDMYDPN
ncbi:MAG: DivIVA domain-containing protein [Defluviitaleaceae bacterium]|nr:DivIVA domain-containing protein [Defluviitaleaceae bacterium]